MNTERKKQFLKFFTAILIMIFLAPAGLCIKNFELRCSPESVNLCKTEDPVEVSVSLAEDGVLPESFNVKINFDGSAFRKYASINYSDEIAKNYKHKKEISDSGVVTIKCSLNPSGASPHLNKNQKLFSLKFIPKKSSKTLTADFAIMAEESWVGKPTGTPTATSQSIEKIKNSTSLCKLTKLIPSEGQLCPEFKPDIYEYSLDVSRGTKDIYFETESSNNASIKVNRHKLGAAGSKTDIYITIKEDKNDSKKIYHILVNRQSRLVSSEKANSKNSLIKSISKTGKKKSGKKNTAAKKYDVPENYEPKKDETPPRTNQNILINSDKSENNGSKTWLILIGAIVLTIMTIYAVIQIKKSPKMRKTLNNFFRK